MIEPAAEAERKGRGVEIAAVAAVVGILTLGAVKAFPQMDDAYLLLLLKERGAGAIRAAHPDRPLVAALWQGLAAATGSSFWRAGFLGHFVLWCAVGLVTGAIWRRLFPGAARFAVLASVLAVAPIIVRTQLSTVTVSLLCVLSVVPVWIGALSAWNFAVSGRAGRLAAALALAAGGAILSEYGAVAAVSGAALLAVAAPGSARRARAAAGALAGTALACYAAYLRMGNFAARPLVDPGKQLSRASLPVRASLTLATRFWDAAIGDLLRAASAVQVEWQTKTSLVAIAFGAGLGALFWRACRRSPSPVETAFPRRGVAALAVSLAAGLLPISLMRPVFRSDFASRFEIAVLPVAASLTVAVVMSVARARILPVVAAFLGLVVGAAVVQSVAGAVRQRRAMDSVAAALEPLVPADGGVTVAVLAANELCHSSQVCTGMVTRSWSADRGRKAWIETREDAAATIGGRTVCAAAAPAGLAERGFERGAPSGEPLWIEVRDGRATVEPYCVGRAAPGGRGASGVR